MSGLAKVPESVHELSGAQKGLLFLVSLEEAVATRVLSNLSPQEVQSLRSASEGLAEIHPNVIAGVHREFVSLIDDGVPTSMKGSGAYLRRLVGQALGEGKAAELWSDQGKADTAVQRLANLDTPSVLAIIEREHPQTIAVILSQFSSGRAAEVMKELPTERQAEVMVRLTQLASVPTSVMEEMDKQFAREMESMGDGERVEIKGVRVATNMLKRLDAERSEALIDELASIDSALADQLRTSMFTFEDLIRIDGRGMQQMLKEVKTESLVVALKTASDEIREKVFGSVSSRASAMLREELDLLGPMRVSDVEQAQQAIVEVALNLEREGRITIAEEGGTDYV